MQKLRTPVFTGHPFLNSRALTLGGTSSSRRDSRLLKGHLGGWREQSKRRPIGAATPLVLEGGTGDRPEPEGQKGAGRELSVVLADISARIFKVNSSPPILG